MLLELPAGLLHAQVLARLSLADLGSLALACRALRGVVESLPDELLKAATRQPSTHPVHRAACTRTWLSRQANIASAIRAGPDAWAWSEPTTLNLGAPTWPSPDRTRAVARLGMQLLLWKLQPEQRQLACVQLPGPPAAKYARCDWSSDGDVVCWSDTAEDGSPPTLVSMYRLSTGQLARLEVPEEIYALTPAPCFLPGRHSFLLGMEHAETGELGLCVLDLAQGSSALVRHDCHCGEKYADYGWAVASGVGDLAFMTGPSSLCLWRPGEASRTVILPGVVSAVVWSPDGCKLLCRGGDGSPSVFVDSAGRLLSQQHVFLGQHLRWGQPGVLCQRHDDRSRLELFAVLGPPDQPLLELQHRFVLSGHNVSVASLCLSPDLGSYFACTAGALRRPGTLVVCALPRPRPAGSGTSQTVLPDPALLPEHQRLYQGSYLHWLPDCSALECTFRVSRRTTHRRLVSFVKC